MTASNLDVRRLRHFLAVLDAGGVREASRRIRIAQPALSRTVAELEDELGLTLFAREGRRMVPTSAALSLAAGARAVLGQFEALVSRAQALAGGTTGQLRVGTSPSATFHPLVPELVRRLLATRPGLELELVEGSSAALLDHLAQYRLEAAFVRPSSALPPGLAAEVLARERLLAVVAAGHPLAARRTIRPATLFEHPLLLPSPALGSSLRGWVERAALDHGARLTVAAHASHVASLVHLAASGLGVALVPASMRSLRTRGVRFVAISGAALPLMLASRDEEPAPALAIFLAHARRRAPRASSSA